MLRRVILTVLLIGLIPGLLAAQSRKLPPVDEGKLDPSFKAFRDGLIAAAKKRDETVLYESLDSKITSSYGGNGGVTEFKQHWKMGKGQTKLWDELATILALGGSFATVEGERSFCAPYVYSTFPDDLDGHAYAAITGKGVRVRAEPNLNAAVVIALSYDLVQLDSEPSSSDGNSSEWVKIITPNGKKGYVSTQYIRSPTDYRACFAKKRGKWLMTALVAGD